MSEPCFAGMISLILWGVTFLVLSIAGIFQWGYVLGMNVPKEKKERGE